VSFQKCAGCYLFSGAKLGHFFYLLVLAFDRMEELLCGSMFLAYLLLSSAFSIKIDPFEMFCNDTNYPDEVVFQHFESPKSLLQANYIHIAVHPVTLHYLTTLGTVICPRLLSLR
jgi:hypothetical protein